MFKLLRRGAAWFRGHGMESVLGFMSLALFLVASNTQTGWLNLVSAALVAVLVLGWAGPRRALAGLRAERQPLTTGVRDQPVTLAVTLSNKGRTTRRYLVVEQGPWPWDAEPKEARRHLVEQLDPGQSCTVRLSVRPAVRGLHRPGPVWLRCASPFGLFAARRAFPQPTCLLVYPDGPDLQAHPLERSGRPRKDEAATLHRAGASHELRRVRAYAPGEDLRRVHWPSTARTGQIMVREFRQPGSRRLVVLLANLAGSAAGSYPHTSLEDAVSAACSLARFAWRRDLPLDLAAFLNGKAVWLADASRARALDLLARLDDDGPHAWDAFLKPCLAPLELPCDLVLLTCRPPDGSALERLADLRARGAGVKLVLFHGPSYSSDADEEPWRAAAAEADRAGLPLRLHRREDDLRESLQC